MKRPNSKKAMILDTASFSLAEYGHDKFSMRNIAQECGIHLKSLQYYFPTKQVLLNEVVTYAVQRYYTDFNMKFSRLSDDMDPDQIFETFVKYTFNYDQKRFGSRFFPELWAMASHDKGVSEAVDRLYIQYRQTISEMISAVNPKLTASMLFHRATIIAATLEGMILFIGESKPKHKDIKGLKKELIKQCLLMAKL